MDANQQRSLQSSIELVKADITYLTVQTRTAASDLYTKQAMGSGDIMGSWATFINLFYQLYSMFKYNADQIGRITDWPEKKKIYDGFFKDVMDGRLCPKRGLMLFDYMFEDLVKGGVYNLTADEFRGKGDHVG